MLAAKAYHEALALRPTDPLAFDGLGLLAQAAGKWDEAARDFGQAKAGYANDPVADRGLATARVALGDAVGGLAALEDLHRIVPNDADAWVESGKLRVKRGDPNGAAADFQQARRLGGTCSDPDLLRLLIESYRSQGRTDDERSLLDDLQVSQGVADARHYARRARAARSQLTCRPPSLICARPTASIRWISRSRRSSRCSLPRAESPAGAIGLYRGLAAKKPALKPELAGLEKRAGLTDKPLRGTVNQINQGLSRAISRPSFTSCSSRPGLHGDLKIRVIVGSDGRAESEELLVNSVRSPELAANLRWNAHDARYPPTAAHYVFKFALK